MNKTQREHKKAFQIELRRTQKRRTQLMKDLRRAAKTGDKEIGKQLVEKLNAYLDWEGYMLLGLTGRWEGVPPERPLG